MIDEGDGEDDVEDGGEGKDEESLSRLKMFFDWITFWFKIGWNLAPQITTVQKYKMNTCQ